MCSFGPYRGFSLFSAALSFFVISVTCFGVRPLASLTFKRRPACEETVTMCRVDGVRYVIDARAACGETVSRLAGVRGPRRATWPGRSRSSTTPSARVEWDAANSTVLVGHALAAHGA